MRQHPREPRRKIMLGLVRIAKSARAPARPNAASSVRGLPGENDDRCEPRPEGEEHAEHKVRALLAILDEEAREKSEELQIKMARAGTVGTHPFFIEMIRELVLERMQGTPKRALGDLGPSHDVCPVNCCLRTVEITK